MTPRFRAGDRIRMVFQPEDPNPIEPGIKGTVTDSRLVDLGGGARGRFEQIDVDWDDGRKLMVVLPPDQVRRVWEHETAHHLHKRGAMPGCAKCTTEKEEDRK